jgi:membrane associated rhomboid family serine protease
VGPHRQGPPGADRTSPALRAALVVGSVLAVLWAVQLVDSVSGYWLVHHLGIVPRQPRKLEDVLTAPFLHASWSHIEANTPPLAVLAFLVAWRSIRRFVAVSLVVLVASGLGVWLVAPAHTDTVGASGVIFGYLGYLLARGAIERRLLDVVVAVLAGALYWSVLPLVLPGNPGISWQAHLFGLAGGLAAAWWLRTRTPAPVAAPAPVGLVSGWEATPRPVAGAGGELVAPPTSLPPSPARGSRPDLFTLDRPGSGARDR